jgi:tetratricopeptide (TPR) repeat protein
MAGLVVAAAFAGWLSGHPDPWHNIELITAEIDRGDHRPPLFYSRGVEYRAVGRFEEAEKDFEECLRRDAEFLPARKDLAAVRLERGRLDGAAATAREAISIASTKSAPIRASCSIILAKIELARRRFQDALDAIDEALKLVPRGELDWFLLRADALRALGRDDEAVTTLKQGHDALKSSVLRTAWLDALIRAGRGAEALPAIETEITECRYKASWLIRRARVNLAAGSQSAANADLRAALLELETHIHPDEPDPMLMIERGLALALLGDKSQASAELARIREITTEPEVLGPLVELLEPPTRNPQTTKAPATSR